MKFELNKVYEYYSGNPHRTGSYPRIVLLRPVLNSPIDGNVIYQKIFWNETSNTIFYEDSHVVSKSDFDRHTSVDWVESDTDWFDVIDAL